MPCFPPVGTTARVSGKAGKDKPHHSCQEESMKDGNPEPLVLRQDEGAVARLILNSPMNYNALSTAMIDALSDALDEVAGDEGIRAIILAARGKAFCAGHDLREIQGARRDEDSGRNA